MREFRSAVRRVLGLVAAAVLVTAACGADPAIEHEPGSTDNPVYFVHGYANSDGEDCRQYWRNAVDEFSDNDGNRPLRTVGFYVNDSHCDVTVGSGRATVRTTINRLAADLAHHVYQHNTRQGQEVDLVGHSMGGIVSRVAVLGSARGWPGFPDEPLHVGNVVTLDSPHGGAFCDDAQQKCPNNPQWRETEPGSPLMTVLHAPENRLDQEWARGTTWTFVGSDQDRTVSGDSGTDEGFYSDSKVRYLRGSEPTLTHTAVTTATWGNFTVRVWRAEDDRAELIRGAPSPLRIAVEAAS